MVPLNATLADSPGARLGVALVTAGDRVLAADPLRRVPSDIERLAAALADRIVRCAAGSALHPPEIRVRHPELAAALRSALAGAPGFATVPVSAVPGLPALEAAAADLLAHLGAAGPTPGAAHAPAWSGWGLPAATVRELFAAAALFYRAAPWRSMGDDQFLFADLPGGETCGTCVLGQAGEQFGLVLYTEPLDYFAMYDRPTPESPLRPGKGAVFVLSFTPADDLPRAARREILAAGWEVAAPAAYPDLMTLNTPGGGVSGEQASLLATLLRLVPRFVGRHRLVLELPEPPRRPVEWRDEESGITLVYEGRAGEAVTTVFGPITTLAGALPTGPGARPEAALAPESDRMAADLGIVGRYGEHLAGSRMRRATVTEHVLAAITFVAFLNRAHGVTLASATEFDFRVFLYDAMPRAVTEMPRTSLRGVPGSLRRLVRYLREHEGIDYPWAEPILRDREAFELRVDSFLELASSAPRGKEAERALAIWCGTLLTDVEARLLLPGDDIAGGVPWGDARGRVAEALRRELERRWLLWRDELIARGVTDRNSLGHELEARRLAWEQSPHPGHGGRTPLELVQRGRKARRGAKRRGRSS